MPRSAFKCAVTLLMLSALPAATGCRREPEGAVQVAAIGGTPRILDPAQGPLTAPDAVLLQNVAQGLVRFDASGNIIPGLAERWNVSDDGLSYIFRIAATNWPQGGKITAQQVARLLKRQLATRSKNALKDALGGVADVVAMTDRVIEIRLIAPRPNLLPLLAQPEFAILRDRGGTGPFTPSANGDRVRLDRSIISGDDEAARRQEVLLAGVKAPDAVAGFASGKFDLVLGGTFADLPYAQRLRLPRGSLRFDPASGLFGLVPTHADGVLANDEARVLLSQAIDRGTLIAALNIAGLVPRATLLEPGLDGVPAPAQPAWLGTPIAERSAALTSAAARLFKGQTSPTVRVFVGDGPGADILFNRLSLDWSALGLTVERAGAAESADLKLVDLVAPSSSPAWFVRQFRCGAAPLCSPDADQLMDAGRQTQVPAQRYALLQQAAAIIDEHQLFIPITAPVRWSLVSRRIQGFAGNRYARHTLTDLEQKPGSE